MKLTHVSIALLLTGCGCGPQLPAPTSWFELVHRWGLGIIFVAVVWGALFASAVSDWGKKP